MNRYDSRVKEIGARIKAERTSMGLSVKAFLLKLYMSESSHKTVLAWERGERLPDLDSLVRMSELFECDVGYLLCDYDERTRDCADVCTVTGLSAEAIENIRCEKHDNGAIAGLDFLLKGSFEDLHRMNWYIYKAINAPKSGEVGIMKPAGSELSDADRQVLWGALESWGGELVFPSNVRDFYASQAAHIFQNIITR